MLNLSKPTPNNTLVCFVIEDLNLMTIFFDVSLKVQTITFKYYLTQSFDKKVK